MTYNVFGGTLNPAQLNSAMIQSTALRPDRSAQCTSPGVCMCEACRCSAATVANDSACLYESLVLYIYSAQPSCMFR